MARASNSRLRDRGLDSWPLQSETSGRSQVKTSQFHAGSKPTLNRSTNLLKAKDQTATSQ